MFLSGTVDNNLKQSPKDVLKKGVLIYAANLQENTYAEV